MEFIAIVLSFPGSFIFVTIFPSLVTNLLKLVTFLSGRDRLVVRTLRCGRSNPGSNPGHGTFWSARENSERVFPALSHVIYYFKGIVTGFRRYGNKSKISRSTFDGLT
jgi:hypothetical protein